MRFSILPKYSAIHLMISAMLPFMMSGCILEETVPIGDPCPPSENGQNLSYIYALDTIDYSDNTRWPNSYLYNVCPKEYPSCSLDTDHQYYCMTACLENQIGCHGKCIDPMTDPTYCGATSCPSDIHCCQNYITCNAFQTCIQGNCVDKLCTEEEQRCINGRIEQCSQSQWQFKENCATGECMSDWHCSSPKCTDQDARCTHNRYEICAKGTWVTSVTCQSGDRCVKTLGCVPEDTCLTTFYYYNPWTAIASGGTDNYEVYLVGSFNVDNNGYWKETDPAYKMTADGYGSHTITVKWPLNSSYEYKYYVKGWAQDSWKTDAHDGLSNSVAQITACGLQFGHQN